MFRLLITARSFGISNPTIIEELDKIEDFEYLRPNHTKAFDEREMVNLSKDATGIVVGTDKITKSVIKNAKNLKIIMKHGVGIDNIDLASAIEAGIMVTNLPGINDTSVAEMAFMFILSYSRGVIDLFNNAQMGKWGKYISHDVFGKTLGVVGTGRIGREVIKRAIAFGMNILAYDVIRNPELENNPNVQYTNMDTLLCPTDSTDEGSNWVEGNK
jgi:D-3-phosphoglycerate dehydrogenase